MDYEDEELNKQNAVAIAENEMACMFITDLYECGWEIHIKENDKWHYDEETYIVKAMKKLREFTKKHEITTCTVASWLLDPNELAETDRQHDEYARQEMYADACMASAYGDESMMNRYNRTYGEEKEYGPSNPWDAPGMKVSDFI